METVFVEHPLLNSPHLVGLILRKAKMGKGSVDACMEALDALVERSREKLTLTPDEIRERFDRLVLHLSKAKLLEGSAANGFTITPRGLAALEKSPEGFATADLMAYPEYAIFVREQARSYSSSDPHASAYDLGADAFRKGMSRSANPFNPDSADHQVWQNGWSNALTLNRS
jgi:hypothetical protein